jgi:hypothetical protein
MAHWHTLGRLGWVCSLAVACGGPAARTQAGTGGSTDGTPSAAGGNSPDTLGTSGGNGTAGSAGESAMGGAGPEAGGATGGNGAAGSAGDSAVGGSGAEASGGSGTAGAGANWAIGGAPTGCTVEPPVWADCDSVGEFAPAPDGGGVPTPPETLTAIDDVSPLVAQLREQAKATILRQYSDYSAAQRATKCSPRTVCPATGGRGTTIDMMGGSGTSIDTTGTGSTSSTRSGTNVQVLGVDEPDLMKLDARYVYIVLPDSLLILDALDPATTTSAARLVLEGTPKSMLINGDRALVIASAGVVAQKPSCTYAYDCQFWGDGLATVLLVVDLADRTHPRIVRRISLSGSYLGGRMIGSNAHIITSDVLRSPPINWPYPDVRDATAIQALASLESQYTAAIASVATANVALTLPTTTDQSIASDGSAEPPVTVSPDALQAAPRPGGVLTVTSLDFTAQASPHQDMIFSNPGALYASGERLYMAIPEEKSNWPGYGLDATWIHGFSLAGASATYQGSGRVTGHILNQFSLDEYAGDLRVATSTSRVPDPSVHSTVSILGWQDNQLVLKGAVDQIAPGEDIRAVRFMGQRGYVVTFKKTDPLFVLDLADPALPRMLGELQIPGFSTYIHPLDDQHLLTMGYTADDQGSFAYFNGIQLQILNVADPANPTLLSRETIGTRGSSSEALTDHLAFNYFAPKQMLALPMTICEGGGNGAFGDVLTFTGLLVYDVTIASGFSLRGRVPHPAPSGYYGSPYPVACSNWWTQASSPVKRSAFIEDYVLSLGDALVKVNSLADLANTVASFPVGTLPCEVLSEADCGLAARCQVIRGISLASGMDEYLGCASIPSGQTSLACQAGPSCIMDFSSKACATVPSSCVPDGWGTLAAQGCTAALCGS